EVTDDWFVYALDSADKRNSIANSAGKIIGISGPTTLNSIWEGAANHARRQKYTVAPPSVIQVVLEYAGFSIDAQGYVHGNEQEYKLSGAETLFVEVVQERFGGCASFWDLYDSVVVSGKYSLPTLSSVLLRTSPIVATITTEGRTSFYGIRGRSVEEARLIQARQRQPSVTSDSTLSYTLDGFLIESSVTTWMVTSGVVTLPSNAHIPEENWKWTTGSESGTAVTSETFLYGFSAAMRDLGVSLGNKVRFSFDVANRLIEIRALQGSTDDKH
ncbi:MAG: hypothetical protein ACOC4I_06785, partial [Spirochaetota bacterium]